MCASAKGTASASSEGDSLTVFHRHGYIDLKGGFQQTLGEISTLKLNNPNVQIAGGYQITPLWGVRLTVGGWQSKDGMTLRGNAYPYKWYYVAPTLNATFDITNAIWGYKENRIVSWGVFAGPGLNIAFKNDEAHAVSQQVKNDLHLDDNSSPLNAIWDGTKAYAVAQAGTNVDFRVSKRVRIGVEANFNFLADSYNSKYVKNVDWYFNFLAGVKVLLGKTSSKAAKPEEAVIAPVPTPCPCDEPKKEEEPKKVEEPAQTGVSEVDKLPESNMPRYNVFFAINSKEVNLYENVKVKELAELLEKHPDMKVGLYGYADQKTGTPAINKRLATMRVDEVSSILVNKYHINANRISKFILGDTEQPFEQNELNRVVICITDEAK